MKEYIFNTHSTCFSEYIVRAENEEEAKEKFYGGEFESERDVDFRDEQVDDIRELEGE